MIATAFLDALSDALDRTAGYAANAEAAPVAILWPDEAGQWLTIAKRLGAVRPVLTLGDYDADAKVGPAYWIRCVVDAGFGLAPDGLIPVVYLPGHSRAEVRAVEDAAPSLQPIAELQYRGVSFSQRSGRDWTIAAFLQASENRGGLSVAVAGDDATKAAMLRAAAELPDRPVDELRSRAPLKADYFDGLLAPDVERDVLRWLNDPIAFADSRRDEQLASFRARVKEHFRLDISRGELEFARALGQRRTAEWGKVWQAYADAPKRYQAVEERLRAARPSSGHEQKTLFDVVDAWPQENEEQEAQLLSELKAVAAHSASTARDRILDLNQRHGIRRHWVWAQLGKSPLAFAIADLATLANLTKRNYAANGMAGVAAEHVDWGSTVDDAVMQALAGLEGEAASAVGAAAAAVYRPWLETAAVRMQDLLRSGAAYVTPPVPVGDGTCLLFTDGLRFDVARRLQAELAGYSVEIEPRLTALPSITPTAKPAATPIAGSLVAGPGLSPLVKAGGPEMVAPSLRKALADAGFEVLGAEEVGSGSGRGWTEGGDIDALGHEHQLRLPSLLDSEVRKLAVRIRALLAAGWKKVMVITDHGWLYLPGGLPPADLPIHLTAGGRRKHRAARLLRGADAGLLTVPWYWDSTVAIAMAPDIRSFEGSPVYDHGGLTPQECVTPVMTVSAALGAAGLTIRTRWSGLRVYLTVDGTRVGAIADLRSSPGDPQSSIAKNPAEIEDDGKATLLVMDSDLEGRDAILVLVDSSGRLLLQETVTVGGA